MNKIVLKLKIGGLDTLTDTVLKIKFKNNKYANIYWGDESDNEELKDDNNIQHNYSSSRNREIILTIVGYFTNIKFCENNLISEIIEFNCEYMTNLNRTFENNHILELIHNNAFNNTNNIRSMMYTFSNCSKLSNINNNFINDLDKLESVDYMFDQCELLDNINDCFLSSAEILKSAAFLFSHCCNLNNIPRYLFKDNSQLRILSYTFNKCVNLINTPNSFLNNNPELNCIQHLFGDCVRLFNINSDIFDNSPNLGNVDRAFTGVKVSINFIIDKLKDSNKYPYIENLHLISGRL